MPSVSGTRTLRMPRAELTARRALNLAKRNKNLISGVKLVKEQIEGPLLVAANNVAWTFNANPFTKIREGNGQGYRNANYINVSSIGFKGYVAATHTVTYNQRCRVVLFMDNRNDAEVTSMAELFNDANVTDNGMLGGRNVLYKQKFTVLMDRVITLDGKRNGSGSFKFNRSYKRPLRIKYKSDGGTIADLDQKCLYIAFAGDDTTTSNQPFIYYSIVVRYTD